MTDHGLRGYKVHGCRCDVCLDAQLAHQRDYRARKRGWEQVDDERTVHVHEHKERRDQRVCAYTDCPTILSMYNDSAYCHVHRGPDRSTLRLDAGMKVEDELRKLGNEIRRRES